MTTVALLGIDIGKHTFHVHQILRKKYSRRLLTIPGIGPMAASALVAEAGDASNFKCGRDFVASRLPKNAATSSPRVCRKTPRQPRLGEPE